MRQRNKHLPPALSDTADVVLHNGDLARKAVLITQPLEYPLRCVTLLLRTILILFQDTVDNTDERIELRADRRPRPDITRWHRIAQHLPDRARVDPKTTSRFALAQTLNHYRVANPPIQFHSLHPPPFAPKCKGLSLTEFCSGATRLSGRFSEGLLLRRSQNASRRGCSLQCKGIGGASRPSKGLLAAAADGRRGSGAGGGHHRRAGALSATGFAPGPGPICAAGWRSASPRPTTCGSHKSYLPQKS